MVGTILIIKKEIADAISDRTFLIAVSVLVASLLLTGIASGDSYYKNKTFRASFNPEWSEILIILNMVPPIRFLGAIVAVAFSFSAINKERAEGSLKVLLSYPIYRDQVILGKLVAGFLLISFVTVISMCLSLTVYSFLTSTSITLDLLSRFGVEMSLAILLLCGYLGLSMSLSIAFNDPKITLITSFLFLGLFNSISFVSFSNILASSFFNDATFYIGNMPWWEVGIKDTAARALQVFVSELNPSQGFNNISLELGYATRLVNLNGVVTALKTDILGIILEHLSALTVLIVFPVVTYLYSYIAFNKSDVS